MEIVWQEEALRGYQKIMGYIRGEFGDLVAYNIAQLIIHRVDTLADFPNKGRFYRKIKGYEIRELFIKLSGVYYTQVNDKIYILSINDTRNSPSGILRTLRKQIGELPS